MYALKVIKSLGPVDLQSVRRDPLLRWMVWLPVLIALLARWVIPVLVARIDARYGFDLAPYDILLASILLVTIALMFGMIIGFLLLDQRDDNTLIALQVTPLSLNGYFLYRIGLPIGLSVVINLIILPLTDLVELDWVPLFLAALAAAPLGPIFALALASFASNKVQGFALTKASGVLFLAPVIAYFVPLPWQLAFGLLPTYWPARVFWMGAYGEPHAWAYLLAGLAYQALLLAVLLRLFNRIMQH